MKTIFHPSDFTESSNVAFAHALKFALLSKARLSMLHVSEDPHGEEGRFPGIRELLVQWGVLPADCGKDAVAGLGVAVRKVVKEDSSPLHAILSYLQRHPADLIVMATHQRQSMFGWSSRSVSRPMVRNPDQMILFVPDGTEGFVSCKTGEISLRSVLVPIDHQPHPQAAVSAAARSAHNLGCTQMGFTLLHVGPEGQAPPVTPPQVTGYEWKHLLRQGPVVETILATAAQVKADMIVMGTDGQKGILDTLRGTTTEQVLRQARCPLLVIPAISRD